jgi:serine/threonine protein kinase/tetratricopeptide (TPR) repeat protein
MQMHARFGPYEIVEEIGHGGMGKVYRARDARLNRDVALKVVAETYLDSNTPTPITPSLSSHERFLREARASSALNHPNICTIYDVGEQDGRPYLVMELLEGDTLKRVIHGHSLPLDQLLDYGIQLCCALSEAHGRGILHRDIKPTNLFVTRRDQGHGILKVLDFGIAKYTTSNLPGDATMSMAEGTFSSYGLTPGTAAYMAPEQARGEPVDARADVFAAGVVLYEMATGSAPFFGASIPEIFASLLTHEPESIRKRNPQFPRDLERVIFKALAKDRDHRYASAAELAADLAQIQEALLGRTGGGTTSSRLRVASGQHPATPQRTGGASAGKWIIAAVAILLLAGIAYAAISWWKARPRPKLAQTDSIIVSEFTNRTGDPAFNETLRQALSVQLQQSPSLDVVSDEHLRDSLAYLEKPSDEKVTPAIAREIAEREGIKAVVNGTVSNIGNEYLITLAAQNAVTGDVLAREAAQADGEARVLGALRNAAGELAQQIAAALPAVPKPDAVLKPATTSSLQAFRAYARGERQLAQANFSQSVSSYQQAVDLDPSFAMAYARMGVAYVAIGNQSRGNAAIAHAFDLASKVSDRERLYIRVQYNLDVTGDLPQAIDALRLYGQSYPNEPKVPTDLSVAYLILGEYEQAYEQAEKAVAMQPKAGSGYVNAMLALTSLNRFAEAKDIYQKAESLGLADDASIRGTWIFTAYLLGDNAAVRQQMDWARDRTDGFLIDLQMALLDEHQGRLQKAAGEWQRAIERMTQQKMESATAMPIAQRTLDAALAGNCGDSTSELQRALQLDQDRSMQGTAAIAYGLCGEPARAMDIEQSLAKAFPQDTLVNHVYLPDIRAAIELGQKRPQTALEALRGAEDYDTLGIGSYLRGLAHLALKDGAAAESDFNVALGHRSIFVLSQQPGMNVAYPLSLLGLARAEALQGDKAKARAQYAAFFAYWKDADPDLAPLLFARTEAAALGP